MTPPPRGPRTTLTRRGGTAGAKESPLASNDVLFELSGVELRRVHDHAVGMAPSNYVPAAPGDPQPYR